MNINLKKTQLEILSKTIKTPELRGKFSMLLDSPPLREQYAFNSYTIKITALERAQILDELSNALCQHGLDENDAPNKLGNIIEELIDIFNDPS